MCGKINNVLNNWDIPPDLPIREIDESDGVHYLGHVWFIGDNYVLKKHPNEERNNQERNLRILSALDNQGFTSAPLYTKGGAAFVEISEEDSFYTLTRYVPGKTLTDEEIGGDRMPEYGYKVGQALAKLHLALVAAEDDLPSNSADPYKRVVEWAIPKTKKANHDFGMGLDESLFDEYIEEFGKLQDKLPRQLIHRDANPDNIIFNNGEVSGFIDFIISERNMRLWDVCYFLTGLGDSFYDESEKWLAVIKGLLNGYNSLNPLTDEEKQSIFYVMCSIQFTCVAYFVGNEKYKRAWEQNRKLTGFVVKNKDRIIEIGMGVK